MVQNGLFGRMMNVARNLVMVVDDDSAVRESLKFSLEIEGLAVHACASGAELLNHPDLSCAGCLVLDDAMPAMDGFEVLEQLTRQSLQIPVILMTVNATPKIRQRAARAGVRHLLEKPLLDNALVDGIRDVLGRPVAP